MPLERDISFEITGKLGDRVYYYWNGEPYSRAYFIPNQPGTALQMAGWMKFKLGVKKWHDLTPAEKVTYNQKAKRHHFSGFNLWMREFLNGP